MVSTDVVKLTIDVTDEPIVQCIFSISSHIYGNATTDDHYVQWIMASGVVVQHNYADVICTCRHALENIDAQDDD